MDPTICGPLIGKTMFFSRLIQLIYSFSRKAFVMLTPVPFNFLLLTKTFILVLYLVNLTIFGFLCFFINTCINPKTVGGGRGVNLTPLLWFFEKCIF